MGKIDPGELDLVAENVALRNDLDAARAEVDDATIRFSLLELD